MVDIDTANYKSEIKRLERELAARNEQLIVATRLADSRYNEIIDHVKSIEELVDINQKQSRLMNALRVRDES